MELSAFAIAFAFVCWNIKKRYKNQKELYRWIFIAGVLVGLFGADTAFHFDMLKDILEALPQ